MKGQIIVENQAVETQAKTLVKKGIIPKAPGFSWTALILLWFVFAINGTGREMFNRVMPLIANDFNISAGTVGVIVTLITLAGGTISIWVGAWSDRKGRGWARKKSLIWMIIAYTLFGVLTGFPGLSSVLVGVLILQMIRSAFSAASESIECTAASEWWPAESRGFVLGAHHTGYPWGTLLSGIIISVILVNFGNDWRMPFLTLPLLAIPIFAAYWIFSSSSNFKKYTIRASEMGLTTTINEDNEPIERKGAIKESLKNPNILVGAILLTLSFAGYIGIGFWLSPYLAFTADFSFAEAALWSVVFTITGGLGQIVWGVISDKIGRRKSLLILFGWLTIGFYLLQYVGNGLGWLIAIQLFIGCATNAVYPVVYALVTESAKKGFIGTAMGILITGTYIGGFSPLLLGMLINIGGGWEVKQGYIIGLYFLSALMIIAFLLVLLFTRETVGKKRGKDWSLVSLKSCGVEEA